LSLESGGCLQDSEENDSTRPLLVEVGTEQQPPHDFVKKRRRNIAKVSLKKSMAHIIVTLSSKDQNYFLHFKVVATLVSVLENNKRCDAQKT
jgi:hypothetical protein